MKKIFNTLLVTVISLISVFAFCIVHADGGGHSFSIDLGTCIYDYGDGNIIIEASSPEKNVVKLKTRCTYAYRDFTRDIDNSKFMKYDYLQCPTLYYKKVTVKNNVRGMESLEYDYYFSTSPEDGYTKATLKSAEKPNCTSFSEFKDSHNVDDLIEEWAAISSRTNDKYSIVKLSGDDVSAVILSEDIECSELKKYLGNYYNVLNPTHQRGSEYVTEAVLLSEKLQKIRGELQEESIKFCIDENYDTEYHDYYNKIDNTQKKVDRFYKAAYYQSDVIDKRIKSNQCTDIKEGSLRDNLAEDTTKIETYKMEARLLSEDFEYENSCSIIGENFKNFLNTVLFYIRLVAVILAVVLSLLDYIKAASASDDKPMSAANKRFITRLILVIVLFLLPVLLTFILNVLNINSVTGDSIECLKINK